MPHISQTPDSVPLDALREGKAARSAKSAEPRLNTANLKLILALFVIFVIVVSSAFTNTVISAFGEKAVRCRNPTSWGTVLQGIFLVIFYVLALYLIEHRVL
jgi:hypothetical protein